jgi:hypothetical protein
MYGKWLLSVAGVALVVLFIIGMIATAYAPIFAVAIAALLVVVIGAGMASRRSSQVGSERSAAA